MPKGYWQEDLPAPHMLVFDHCQKPLNVFFSAYVMSQGDFPTTRWCFFDTLW